MALWIKIKWVKWRLFDMCGTLCVCVWVSLSRWCLEWPRPTTESSCGWPTRASSPSCRPVAAATWWGRACGSAWTTSSPTSRLSPTYRWGVTPPRRREQALAGHRSLDCVSSVSAGSLEGLQAEEEVQRQAEISDGPQRRRGQGDVPQSPPTLHPPRSAAGSADLGWPFVLCPSQIQSKVRMHQARKKYRDRLKYFKDHVSLFKK